jgi:SAM-dependent methyltransferase
VYGVEPNLESAARLRRLVAERGLGARYVVVPTGIEDAAGMRAAGVEAGGVDCIVSVLCLCSVPEPRENVRRLFGYLKPGGRWYAYEHTKVGGEFSAALRVYQGEY